MCKKYKKCYYCGLAGHIAKECPKEKKDSGKLKNIVGEFFEKFVTKKYNCPNCKSSLRRLADFTPSCDIVCDTCGQKFEVKSKCLSVKNLPEDIRIKHGNFNEFQYKLNYQELNMFLIIYSYDRKSKTLSVRKIYYLPNRFIKDKTFSVISRVGNSEFAKTEIEFTNIPNHLNILNGSVSFRTKA